MLLCSSLAEGGLGGLLLHRSHPEMTRLTVQGGVVAFRLVVDRPECPFAVVLSTVCADQFFRCAFAAERVRVRIEDVPRKC